MSTSVISRVLLVEDDQAFAREFSSFLKGFGFEVESIESLDVCRDLIKTAAFDLVVLDQFVQDRDALQMIPEVLKTHTGGLVILTNNADQSDRIIGLELGADDFIHKLQKPREILARLRAVLRRTRHDGAEDGHEHHHPADEAPRATVAVSDAAGEWRMDRLRREIRTPEGDLVPVTVAEFDVLSFMADRRGEVVERDELYEAVMRREKAGPCDRTLDNLISRVRRALSKPSGEEAIFRPIRGRGYLYIGPEFVQVDSGRHHDGTPRAQTPENAHAH